MSETTLLEMNCKTVLSSFDDVGILSIKIVINRKAWSIFVSDSLHGCNLAHANANNESSSSHIETSSSRTCISLATVYVFGAMNGLTMHCSIALVDRTSAFDVRRYDLRLGMTSGSNKSPADKATRKFSA